MPHSFESALTHRDAPFPIYQATSGVLWSTGARPFQSARQLWARPDQQGHALLTGAHPFQPIRQTEKHPLPPVKETKKPGAQTFPAYLPCQKQQWRLFLACLAQNPGTVEVLECFPAHLPCQKQQWCLFLAYLARNPGTVEVYECFSAHLFVSPLQSSKQLWACARFPKKEYPSAHPFSRRKKIPVPAL
jgi:hypothetical protein